MFLVDVMIVFLFNFQVRLNVILQKNVCLVRRDFFLVDKRVIEVETL